ncbi:FHF complex subunit HOOK-interacting protein 1A-like isoform X2 [Eleginops maclovinus]|uniref:FHF complex subunit HOOK-interacting protein 1A-like isoform X2 n=1 Tax=Eleginops maclovinus TaxID=56733 RepID=UPI0030808DA4
MMASVVARGNRRKSLTLRGVDPETCMIVFKNHWAQVVKILEKHEPSRSGALSFLSSHTGGSAGLRLGPIPTDEASAVQNYVEHMLFLLMEEEAGQGGAMGPILELVVVEGVMERLFLWSLRRQFTEDMKLEQLCIYQMLLSQARQPLLHHKPILRPLMMLLASCAGAATDGGGVVEAELVLLLHQLCVSLVKDPSVLELFFHTSEDQGAANFLLFSLLIPYTHRQGSVGQQARDALLLIMSLSAADPRVARHIAQNTYFCPVLATGLSGLYSSLPARLQVYSEDWHCLDQADWQQVPALVHFMHSLDFCSAVTKVAHPSIRSQLLGYIYNGFLVPVLAPALHKLTVEEVMTTTAYLDLFLRSVSEPALLQSFLSFILLHTHDSVHILDTLVSRVNTPFQLGTVSLALFRTLIGLFCEDVMLQLVFRYLIPCSHLSRRQRSSLQQKHSSSSSSVSFLLLLPSWSPGNNNTHSEHIHWPKAADVSDSVGYCRASDFLMDVNYLLYLWDARRAISTSHRACQRWSSPYDGIDPPVLESAVEEEEDIASQIKNDSPTPAFSPSPPPSDPLPTGNHAVRAGSSLELEWDDIFADDDACSLADGVTMEVSRCTSTPLPPRHIQEMRRTATKLVHGSYVEESDFEDDVLVYDLVAQRETKATNRQSRGNKTTRFGRTVMEAVNSIMSTRRKSEEAEKEERRRSEERRQEAEEMDAEEGRLTNGFNDHIVSEQDDPDEHPVPRSGTFQNGGINHLPGEEVAEKDDFLSRYQELMMSLGVEPDCEDVTNDISSFRRRVRALRQKLGEEEEEEELVCHFSWDDGPFISVLLSRLENLLENSISVNLLLTGILAQLASYPQPLLRDFLLSTHTHSQHNVRTLYQVLVSVHAQIERYVADRPDFPALLAQAWRFLLAKDQDSKLRESLQVQDGDVILDPSLPNGWVRTALSPPPLSVLPPCPPIPPQAKSRVFAIVMFAEFLKELAAIAQEQSIAPAAAEE